MPCDIKQFKAAYMSAPKGKYDLQIQIPYLEQLAEDYKIRYAESRDWRDCLKAHALFNSVALREQDHSSHKAFTMQQLYWGDKSNITYDESVSQSANLKEKLHFVCLDVRNQLAGISPAEDSFVRDVHKISEYCSVKMLKLAEGVMKQSISTLEQRPPCAFSAMAIGSLAKDEGTPYSDLEYLFLVENRTPETEHYFETLAVTSYFIIGNLQQTNLKCMDVEELQWFEDKARSGFSIDGLKPKAGNIPTGNETGKFKNRYILTVAELLKLYQHTLDNPDGVTSITGDLTNMLSYMKFIYIHKSRGTEILALIDTIKRMSPNPKREQANEEMIRNDISKFSFKVDTDLKSSGYTLDVKKQLFRFPSILVSDLAMICKSTGCSSWDTINLLLRHNHISKHCAEVLPFLLASACYIRLSAYLHHNSQDERVSVAHADTMWAFENNQCVNNAPDPHRRWFLPTGLFDAICEKMIPLKNHLETSSRNMPMVEALANYQPTELEWLGRAKLRLFTGRYVQALGCVKFDISKQDIFSCDPDPVEVMETAAKILLRCSKLQQSINIYKSMHYSNLRDCRLEIAECLQKMGHFAEAHQILDNIKPISADEHYTLGLLYSHNPKKTKEAEYYLLESLQMHQRDESQPQMGCLKHYSVLERLQFIHSVTERDVNCLMGLADIYRLTGQLKEAIAYYRKCLDAISGCFGDSAIIPARAHIRKNMGLIYEGLGEPGRAEQYMKRALSIFEDVYGASSDHMYIKQTRQALREIKK